MVALDVDFDVFKALTSLRATETVTYNDVLRELLSITEKPTVQAEEQPGWTWKGVTLPNGSELKAEYKGKVYLAKITNGEWVQDGKLFGSPSSAAHEITRSGINGWWFWSVKRPGDASFQNLAKLRGQ